MIFFFWCPPSQSPGNVACSLSERMGWTWILVQISPSAPFSDLGGWIMDGRMDQHRMDGRPGEVSKENGTPCTYARRRGSRKAQTGTPSFGRPRQAKEGARRAGTGCWVVAAAMHGCLVETTRRDETRRLDRGLRREPGPGYVEFVARGREEKKLTGSSLFYITGNARYGSATHVGGGSNACGQKKATGHAICTGYH